MKVTVILEKEARINVDLEAAAATKTFGEIADMLLKQIDCKIDNVVKEEKLMVHVPYVNRSEPTLRNNRKLVFVECPDCHATIVSMVGQDQETVNCRCCHKDVQIGELVRARYECPNCGYKANFYVSGELKNVKCKGCDSDIDLIYHEKKKMYLSANLFDK